MFRHARRLPQQRDAPVTDCRPRGLQRITTTDWPAARPLRRLLPLTLALVALASCDTGPNGSIPTNIVFPDRNVSYAAHVQPLFDASCATSGCHDEFTQAGGLQLRTYFDLFRSSGIVLPGDSLRSVLCQVMTGRILHQATPISFVANSNQSIGINIWVHEGALNN
jgi:hypothetical protein